jgi:hypothetical protein
VKLRPLVPAPATTAAASRVLALAIPEAAPGSGNGHGTGNGYNAPPLAADVPERITTAQQALDRFHDEASPLGQVRRIYVPVSEDEETGGVLIDWDPFV